MCGVSIGSSANISSQLQSCADTANSKVSGFGHVAGTKKHAVFTAEVNALQNKTLATEVSYLNGIPIAAWDFKTGTATLTAARIEQMQERSGLFIPICIIK